MEREKKTKGEDRAAPGHLEEMQGQPEAQPWRLEPEKPKKTQPGGETVRRDRESREEERGNEKTGKRGGEESTSAWPMGHPAPSHIS